MVLFSGVGRSSMLRSRLRRPWLSRASMVLRPWLLRSWLL
jgi:hypothetical protein